MPNIYRQARLVTQDPAVSWVDPPLDPHRKLTIAAGVDTHLYLSVWGPRQVPISLSGLGTTQQILLRVCRRPVDGEEALWALQGVHERLIGVNSCRFDFTAVSTKRVFQQAFEFGFYDIVLVNGSDVPSTATRESVVPLSPFWLQKALTFP